MAMHKEKKMKSLVTPVEDRILKCHVQDATGLNDFHQLPDHFPINPDSALDS